MYLGCVGGSRTISHISENSGTYLASVDIPSIGGDPGTSLAAGIYIYMYPVRCIVPYAAADRAHCKNKNKNNHGFKHAIMVGRREIFLQSKFSFVFAAPSHTH